jgi:hypothetical protein
MIGNSVPGFGVFDLLSEFFKSRVGVVFGNYCPKRFAEFGLQVFQYDC